MPEPVHDGLEDDGLLADVEAPGQPLPQVGVQHQEVALLDAPLEERAAPVGVRGQDQLVEHGDPHVAAGVGRRSFFRYLRWTNLIGESTTLPIMYCFNEIK